MLTRRSLLKSLTLGLFGAGVTAAASGRTPDEPKSESKVGFYADQVDKYVASLPANNYWAAVSVPFATLPLLRHIGHVVHEEKDKVYEPKLDEIVAQLYADDTTLLVEVMRELWERHRIKRPGYAQVRRPAAKTPDGATEVRHDKIITPRYTADAHKLNNYAVAELCRAPLAIVEELENKEQHARHLADGVPGGSMSKVLFLQHTPLKVDASVEYGQLEVCAHVIAGGVLYNPREG